MRIALNLATRPYADTRPAIKSLRIAMVVLTVVAIGLGFGLRAFHQKAVEARARERTFEAKIAAITRERQGYEDLMRQPANALLLEQSSALNQLFDEKGFSWTLAMEDLETVLPGGVQVTTLEPVRDPKTGRITLKLRVVGPRDKAVDLVRNLEHSRYFLLPTIVGESSESSGGPMDKQEPIAATNRVNFDMLAEYNPAALDEPRPVKRHAAEPAAHKAPAGRPYQPLILPAPNAATTGPRAARPPYTGISRPAPGPVTNPNAKPGGPR